MNEIRRQCVLTNTDEEPARTQVLQVSCAVRTGAPAACPPKPRMAKAIYTNKIITNYYNNNVQVNH